MELPYSTTTPPEARRGLDDLPVLVEAEDVDSGEVVVAGPVLVAVQHGGDDDDDR